MSDDRLQPLRDDVRLLGELLGSSLQTLEGDDLLATVERIRLLAKDARAGDDGAFELLAEQLSALPIGTAQPVARAFAHFLHLANVAEQHHRIRRRRAYRRDPGAPPQRLGFDDTFGRLLRDGVSAEALHDAVCSLQVELVLTAHPTAIARRTLVQKYRRVANGLAFRDRDDLTGAERDEANAALHREVLSAWGTSDVRDERPSPLDEVHGGLVVFDQSLWHALPEYCREIDRALCAATGRGLPVDRSPVRFGSWIGGDRDGNPNVTADVTRRTVFLHRSLAARLYMDEVRTLGDELSMSTASAELRQVVGDAPEPYRALFDAVYQRLQATAEWAENPTSLTTPAAPPEVYLDSHQLGAALRLCAESLEATGYEALANGRLADLRWRLATFDLTLARLDVRQEAARHTDALAAIVAHAGLGDYAEWDEAARARFLEGALREGQQNAFADVDASDEVKEVFETFRSAAALPRSSLGAYVITMASQASDVLGVALLQQMAGVTEPLRIVPLFETSQDLQHAAAVLDALFSLPWYRERIGGRQEVMIGYSDSAKDVGRLAAAWDLYEAQEHVLQTGERHGIEITLFHGRGGSVGRGGGPTHLTLLTQPPGSVSGTLRVTEQGEMLEARFGLPEIAVRTLEVYATSALGAWLRAPTAPKPEWRTAMARLHDDARRGYRELVYDDPQFVEYFRAATPEAELSKLNIGSRPARRKPQEGDITTLRAIPWQFAWTQTRLLLGAWLGVETAFEAAFARGELALLRDMARDWPFFRAILDLTERALATADVRIASEYDRRLVPARLQHIGLELRSRLQRAIAAVLTVTGHRELAETDRTLRQSIELRNPYVDPINLLQIELLHRLRGKADAQVHTTLLMTMNGVAAGMRNTG